MGFPTAISDDRLDFLSGMEYAANVYLLVWGGLNVEKQIVMKAQINQSPIIGSFSELIFDQTDATFDKGSDTDALEGYTVFLSETTDIRDSYWSGRLRTDASPTTLFVELNEVEFADDDFIFILKDVRFATRHPLEVSGVPFIDVDIPFQQPPPAISEIDTDYFGKILDSVGSFDLVITPSATVITSGAAIDTWTLDLDAGTEIAFNANTGAATIRYDTPGFYLPRWTVTDDNGNAQWFTPHVTIEDEALSSAVNLSVRGGSFNYSVTNGASGSVPFFNDLQNLLDRTHVAVYVDSKPDVGGSKIIFTGVIRTETARHDFDANHANINTSVLQLEGIGAQMAKQANLSWLLENKASPATFYELKDATIWRVIASYLLFMTNLNNIHGLSFQETTNKYLFREFPVEESYVLTALENVMFTINAGFDYSMPGEIKLVRNAIFMNTSERNALTTIANWDMEHYYTKGRAGKLWSLDRSHTLLVGKTTLGAGFYNSTSNDVGLLVAKVPGVVAAGGGQSSEINSQILTADQTRDDAIIEFQQRAADGFAAEQDITTLKPEISDVMATQIAPSLSQWHTHTIAAEDNIRGISYDTNTRWLMTDMSININVAEGRLATTPTFQEETADLGYGVNITTPPEPVEFNQPVLSPLLSVGNLGETPSLTLPTGFTPGIDDQPVGPEDMEHGEAKDPTITAQTLKVYNGSWALQWNASQVWLTSTMGRGKVFFEEVTPADLDASHTIQQCIWDPDSDSEFAGYIITNNGNISSPETNVHYNFAIGQVLWRAPVTLTDMLATMIQVNKKDECIIYGKFEQFQGASWSIDQLGGNGTEFLEPSDLDAIGGAVHNQAPGVYNSSLDLYAGQAGDRAGLGATIQFNLPPGATLSSILVGVKHNNIFPGPSTSEDSWVKDLYRNMALIAAGTPQTAARPGDGVTIYRFDGGFPSGVGDTYLIHVSIRGGSFVHIVDVQLNGTSVADHVGTRHSTDQGETFAAARDVGLMTLGDGSFDLQFNQKVLAGMDEKVREAGTPGTFYIDEANGAIEAGQYPKALLKFGRTVDDYLIAPDGGTEGLIKAIAGIGQTDITPNDGSSDGFVVGPGGLAMADASEDHIWDLANFGGSRKLAYTDDLGQTWNFNTDPTAAATWVTVNPRSIKQVYITDGSNILYSDNGGVNLISIPGPGANLLGIAVL